MRRQTFLLLAIIAGGMLYVFVSSALRTPPPPPPPVVTHLPAAETAPPETVRFASATYGLNCAGRPVINHLNIPNPNEFYPEPEKDNVLEALNAICEGKTLCESMILPEILKLDPAPRCKKNLKLSYRCFSYDVPHELTLWDGDTLRIDCTPPEETP